MREILARLVGWVSPKAKANNILRVVRKQILETVDYYGEPLDVLGRLPDSRFNYSELDTLCDQYNCPRFRYGVPAVKGRSVRGNGVLPIPIVLRKQNSLGSISEVLVWCSEELSWEGKDLQNLSESEQRNYVMLERKRLKDELEEQLLQQASEWSNNANFPEIRWEIKAVVAIVSTPLVVYFLKRFLG